MIHLFQSFFAAVASSCLQHLRLLAHDDVGQISVHIFALLLLASSPSGCFAALSFLALLLRKQIRLVFLLDKLIIPVFRIGLLLFIQPIPHMLLTIPMRHIFLVLLLPQPLVLILRHLAPPWISGTARAWLLTLDESPGLAGLTLDNSGRLLALDVNFAVLIENFEQFDDMVSIEVEYFLARNIEIIDFQLLRE